ncbi:MAG: helix-turn-helix domain-containing protein [Actinomycetia bacterium]|nr:helix-turn-helix domain-containing protein [Actinomycetes bacterium]
MNSTHSFGEQLRQARRSAGMSIAELARLAATSRSLIHAYENGTVSPSVARAQTLLDHLNHTLSVTPKNP